MRAPTQFVEKMGGNAYYGGLKEGFVGISPLNEDTVAPGTQAAIDAVSELITSGEWDVFTGTKLHITINDDGTATVEKEEAPLHVRRLSAQGQRSGGDGDP